ncbi:MAG: hypothetical protein JO149_06905 [Gammaproteobacteria bacterium]|nr:hypothetical protein [Gammaproteobacteria bacterium]
MKENTTNFTQLFFENWMKQTKDFFAASEKNFQDIFAMKEKADFSSEQTEKMYAWIQLLKDQWRFIQLDHTLKVYEAYWSLLSKIYIEAADKLMHLWTERQRANNPVKNMQELYGLWLNTCHDIYYRAMQSSAYQTAYGDFLNETLKYWKSATQHE